MSPSGDTNEAVQPPSDTIAPIGCPERSANAFASPLNPKALSLAAISGICCGIHMPSSASRPAANSETPSTTTDALAIFNGVVLQQSKRQMMSLMRPRTAATAQSITPCTQLPRSEEHTSELQSLTNLVCRLLL